MVPQLGSSINKCSLLRDCPLWVKSRHVQCNWAMSALPPKADIDSPDAMLANLNWLGRALSLAGRYAPRYSTAP